MTCVEVLWLTVAVLVAGLLLMVLVTQLVPPRKRFTHFCDECGSLYDAVEAAKYGRGAMRVVVCNAACPYSDTARCVLPVGHEGGHQVST
jgi:hypothetical protein